MASCCQLRCVWLGLALGVAGVFLPAAAQGAGEYQVKAAYLYQFLNFVEWPERAFANAGASFEICVMGADPFGSDLDNTVRGKRVRGRPVHVQRIAAQVEGKSCHVLFIAASERTRLSRILEAVASRPLLTVSELPGFEEQGGIIRFVVEHDNVRLRINPNNGAAAGLQISAKLLSVATVVRSRRSP
jgi:YfiR/HmsC-like